MPNNLPLPLLDPEEQRVLGSLMEKSRITPDNYPLTLNSLTLACNQKSSRKPVVQYDEETVVVALNSLKRKGLINTETGGTSRVTKYRHTLASQYEIGLPEVAVICLLLLRGPQTAGEVNTNSGRLYEFDSLEEVQQTLEELSKGEHPFITLLPRKPGQKEARYAHLLGPLPEDDFEAPEEPARKSVSDLEQRISTLEQQVADMKNVLDNLVRELMG